MGPRWRRRTRTGRRRSVQRLRGGLRVARRGWRSGRRCSGTASFWRRELLPRARGEDRVGLMYVPDGAACYASQILRHTSLQLTAAEIHRDRARGDRAHRWRDPGARRAAVRDRGSCKRSWRGCAAILSNFFTSAAGGQARRRRTGWRRRSAAMPGYFAVAAAGRLRGPGGARGTRRRTRMSATTASRCPTAASRASTSSTRSSRTRGRATRRACSPSTRRSPGTTCRSRSAQELASDPGVPQARRTDGVRRGLGPLQRAPRARDGALRDRPRPHGQRSASRRGARVGWSWTRASTRSGGPARPPNGSFMSTPRCRPRTSATRSTATSRWPAQALAYKTGELELLRLRRVGRGDARAALRSQAVPRRGAPGRERAAVGPACAGRRVRASVGGRAITLGCSRGAGDEPVGCGEFRSMRAASGMLRATR
jgi:hypothetical protein